MFAHTFFAFGSKAADCSHARLAAPAQRRMCEDVEDARMMQGLSGTEAWTVACCLCWQCCLCCLLPCVTLLCIGFVCCLDSALCVWRGEGRGSRRGSAASAEHEQRKQLFRQHPHPHLPFTLSCSVLMFNRRLLVAWLPSASLLSYYPLLLPPHAC